MHIKNKKLIIILASSIALLLVLLIILFGNKNYYRSFIKNRDITEVSCVYTFYNEETNKTEIRKANIKKENYEQVFLSLKDMKYRRCYLNDNKGTSVEYLTIKYSDGEIISFNEYFYGNDEVKHFKFYYSTFEINKFTNLIDDASVIVLS